MRQRAVHRKKTYSIDMRQRAVHHKKPSSIGMCQRAMHRKKPPKSGCRNAIATYIVAERRHFSVTRYAERILHISRAGGTPLPMAGRLTQLAKIFPVIYTTALRR